MITGSRKNNLGASLRTQTYEIVSGVLPDLGGDDEGPNPHELLEAALAACTIITVQMYANRKKMDLQSTEAIVKIIKEEPGQTEISRELTFVGNLTEEEKKRLHEIADKCPVHKILSGPVKFVHVNNN